MSPIGTVSRAESCHQKALKKGVTVHTAQGSTAWWEVSVSITSEAPTEARTTYQRYLELGPPVHTARVCQDRIRLAGRALGVIDDILWLDIQAHNQEMGKSPNPE